MPLSHRARQQQPEQRNHPRLRSSFRRISLLSTAPHPNLNRLPRPVQLPCLCLPRTRIPVHPSSSRHLEPSLLSGRLLCQVPRRRRTSSTVLPSCLSSQGPAIDPALLMPKCSPVRRSSSHPVQPGVDLMTWQIGRPPIGVLFRVSAGSGTAALSANPAPAHPALSPSPPPRRKSPSASPSLPVFSRPHPSPPPTANVAPNLNTLMTVSSANLPLRPRPLSRCTPTRQSTASS
jgi:hypothetical protein